MQTPYFTAGLTDPIDPTKTVENEKSTQKNDRGGSGEQEDEGQMSAPVRNGPVAPAESTGHQNEQNSGFSGVRKILHPAEALDSARHTAELIMKDAIDALIRTKQRLMEILPSLIPTHAADATKVVENVDKDLLVKAEGEVPLSVIDETKSSDEKPSEEITWSVPGGITTNVTMGGLHQSSPHTQFIRKNVTVAKL